MRSYQNHPTVVKKEMEVTLTPTAKLLNDIQMGKITPTENDEEFISFVIEFDVDGELEWIPELPEHDEGGYSVSNVDIEVLNETAENEAECIAKYYGAELIEYDLFY